jgi:hypothetical protein
MQYNQLPVEIFIKITKDIGPKISSRVCKLWYEKNKIILSNFAMCEMYMGLYSPKDLWEKINFRIINEKGLGLLIDKIWSIDYSKKILFFDYSKKGLSSKFFDYSYGLFKYLFVNNMYQHLQKIIEYKNNKLNNFLLSESLDTEFYSGVNFLLAKGVSTSSYIMDKIECENSHQPQIITQLKYLVDHKAINLGYIYYHIYVERKYKRMKVNAGTYMLDIISTINYNLTKNILRDIGDGYVPLDIIQSKLDYEIDKKSYTMHGLLTRSYTPMIAFYTIIKNYIINSGKSVEEVFNRFNYFIDMHMVDLCKFYLGLKLYREERWTSEEKMIEFESYLLSLIHKDIAIYL